jgi:hypothetical protein
VNTKALLPGLPPHTTGVSPLLDPVADLPYKPQYDVNSWFAIGHLQSGDHVIDYLFHLMVLQTPGGRIMQSVVSVTDETTGWYHGADTIVPLAQTDVPEDKLDLQVPGGRMVGDLNHLDLTAQLDGISVDVRLDVESGVLFNSGTGVFPLLGMKIHQYSVPRFATTGTIVIEGETYQVEGVSWFDRQWQHQDTSTADDIHWTWMDINLDNGDAISLWSAPDLSSAQERAWATVLHADGTQTVTAAEPTVVSARDRWVSEESGQIYPTRWTVRIPTLDAEIEVVPTPRKQEIVSQVPLLHKYEGAGTMHGTYRGKQVTGFGYVELVGVWR